MRWYSAILTVFTLLYISNLCLAQNYNYKRGELIKFSSNKYLRKSLYADSSGYYLHVSRNRNIKGQYSNYLIKIDTCFRLVSETELPIKTTNIINEIFFVAGRFIWLHSEFDNAVKSRIYSISTLGLDGKISGTVALDSLPSGDLSNKSIGLIVSPDKESFLFYTTSDFNLGKRDRSIRIIVFDSTLQRVIDKEVSQELDGISTRVEGFTLNNDLSTQIICKNIRGQETGNIDDNQGITPGSYFLLSIYPGEEHLKKQVITGQDMHANSCYFLRDDQKDLHCTGFYSRSDSGKPTSFFDYEVDRNGADTTGAKYELNKEEIAKCFLKPISGKSSAKKFSSLDQDFSITDIITDQPGTIRYIAQSSTVNHTLIMSNAIMVVNKYQISKNIVVLTSKEFNKIDTIILIPKYQSSSYSDASQGYLYFSFNGGACFLYNESARNMRRPVNERSMSYNYKQQGIPAWVEVRSGGLSRYSIPLSAVKESPVFLIKQCFRTTGNEYFVVLQDSDKPKIGKYYFGKINLKN